MLAVQRQIVLRFAGARFGAARERIQAKASARRKVGPTDYRRARDFARR